MRILIIDDERSIRNTLKEILEFEGHEITLAQDGVEGVEKGLASNFDAIFCDIKMPNMDIQIGRMLYKIRITLFIQQNLIILMGNHV